MTKKITSICLIVLSLALFGCKTSKNTSSNLGSAEASSVSEYITLIENNEISYETLSAKMSVELSMSSNSLSSKAELKTIKDQILQISVQPLLGIEMFRIELTPDSVIVLDRLNKRYVAEKYADIKGDLPIEFNFYNMQALFLNQIFMPGEKEISKKQMSKFKLSNDTSGSIIKVSDSMNLTYVFSADQEGKVTSTTIKDNSEKYVLTWNYSDFKSTSNKMFPMKMYVKLLQNNTSKGNVNMDFSRIQLDQKLTLGTSIPDKYKKVTFEQVLKSISNIKL